MPDHEGNEPLWKRARGGLFVGFGLATRAMTLGVKAFVTDGERLLLVRHTYVPGWHLPGGGVERGETIHDAVAKELREETAIEPKAAPELFGFYKNERTSRFDHVALFTVRRFREVGAFQGNREIAESRFWPLDALPDGTTEATLARVREVLEGEEAAAYW